MNFRNISSWCIRNPVAPIVLFVALMIAGLVTFSRMTITQNPDIEFPVVVVGVSQPGAAPAEMEKQVTQQIEAAVRGVNGVDEIDSSVNEGYSQTIVQLQIGTPVDRAVNDVRNAVAQARSNLPEGILEPTVQRFDTSGAPIMFMAVQSTGMSLEQLSWYIDNTVAKRLRGISGVAAVTREGGVNREIRVTLDPAALQAQGLTAAQVNQQLRQSNINAAGGRAEIAGSEQSVRVLGNAATAYDLSQTQISLPGGRFVKLADIANVSDAYSEQRSLAKLDGRQVISFNLQRAKGASDVSVYDDAMKELHKIEKEDPRVHFYEINNSVDYTKNQYKSAMEGLIEGAILAVFVVLLFLRDIRATAISALAIPMSAIPAFWFMDMLGINLNGLSLLAMSLVAGVLVDDAIVEIENIVRHMRMGKSAYQAALDAADEIGLAVLATTMSIIAVFLPVALMPGISGQFFKAFGFTVVMAVLMSLLVARMITPLIAAYFLRSHGEQPHASGKAMNQYLGVLDWSLDTSKAHDYAARHPGKWGKLKSLRYDHRMLMVIAGFVALIITGGLVATLPMTFQPPINVDTSTVQVNLPPGSTLEQTEAVIDRVANMVRQDPSVESAFERINVGNGTVELKLKGNRKVTSTQFERNFSPRFASIADARVNFQSQNGGGPGGAARDIMLFLGGDDPVKLEAAANKIAADMQKLPELRAPRTAGDLATPEIVIKPRFDLAADLGVTTAALSQAIRIATLGDIEQNSAKFSLSDRQVPIQVSLAESQRKDIATLENLPVPTSSGGSVPLKSVAEISFGAGPVSIQRTAQQRRIAVGADLAPGFVTGQAWKKIEALPSVKNLPDGVQRLNLGQTKWQGEMIRNFVIALLAGVLLVFAVLVLLYRRFLSPFVNMGSLWLCPLGAALALHIAGQPLSLPVFIGILMLFGIVAKNSILLVDFAVEMMNHGMPKDEAIREAGHKRAQPIVMTTVAMVAGMLPIALSLSGDASWRAPMGVTVIGGLIFSTLLTLLLVPAYFSIAISLESRIGRLFHRVIGEDAHQVSTPVAAE
ncbi:efflux RND transporter permease subunit [Sphingomonas flavescens]|uniref:efflux RND transporter permease subunit n=1 Tax=Sphingomonas flavescens TaxID=3132797 RepID=UPI00280427D2|nr:efflux RND transporter permease subunit [Sphingomonas limnosediminicola]